MGFDGYGPSQVPRPPKGTTQEGFLADIARRQRIDDRRMDDAAGTSEVASRTPATQITTGTLNGSGVGSASYVVPNVGTSITWVHAVADVSCDASGDDAELWVYFSGSGAQGHDGYGKQPPTALGRAAVGAATASKCTPGTTVALNLYCPIEAGESFTVTFHASPAR